MKNRKEKSWCFPRSCLNTVSSDLNILRVNMYHFIETVIKATFFVDPGENPQTPLKNHSILQLFVEENLYKLCEILSMTNS